MPRSSKAADKTAPTTPATKERTVADMNNTAFPLVVGSFKGKLPGQEGYDPDKDQLIVGWQLGTSSPTSLPMLKYNEKPEVLTAYDFLTDPKTGLREAEKKEPSGTLTVDLTDGLKSWHRIPPHFIWKNGMWLADLIWKADFDLEDLPFSFKKTCEEAMGNWPEGKQVPPSIYHYWATSGEGSYGNYKYIMFELPGAVASKVTPHHPRMWPKDLQESKIKSYGSSSWSKGSPSTPSIPATKAPTLPAGVRMRCPECGHWFTMSDLPGHEKVCGKGEDSDWAMMCHPDCGCATLDVASKPKKGFPRKKTVTSNGASEEKKEVAVASDQSSA